jgi:long-chain acyl-CoA synthetase
MPGATSRPPTRPGTRCAKGLRPALGYLDDPDANKEMFTDAGWMRIGDLCTVDPDGYVRVGAVCTRLPDIGGDL